MFTARQKKFARLVSELINCNPFLPRRIELERQALGNQFDECNAEWNLHPSQHRETVNLERLYDRARSALDEILGKHESANDAAPETLELYLDLVRFVVFHDHRENFEQMVSDNGKSSAKAYKQFHKDWTRFCPPKQFPGAVTDEIPHIFALLFQIRRAFNNVFRNIIGSSPPIINLRAEVWRSIFTHDVRRYYSSMYSAMSDFPTLITGPTGSGKELVAQAIGLSGYIPFDTETMKWATPLSDLFTSLNISALSPTLVESELFGHAKGSFTGATDDRVGWLETCPKHGAVFIDELGELDPKIQVKLLRVFEDRAFQRLGETASRHFQGRIIAATNRDLAQEVHDGRFRLDFYYRLCADRISTPSLAERCGNDCAELTHLVQHLMGRVAGEDSDGLAAECIEWICENLPKHPWPGNVRELDQCMRSWLLRQDYQPLDLTVTQPGEGLERSLAGSSLSAEELVSLYCRVKYEQNGSYVKTAEALQIDRRTVKSRIAPH